MISRQQTGILLSRIIATTCLILVYDVHVVYSDLDERHYLIESNHLPEVRFRPPIGNGHVATNVQSDTVYMNGLYNGREDRSSRARLPAYVSLDITATDQYKLQRKYVLDMLRGLFIQKLDSDVVFGEITYFAHRTSTRLLVTQISLTRKPGIICDLVFNVTSYQGRESNDFNWEQPKLLTIMGTPTRYLVGTVKEPEMKNMAASVIHIYHTSIPRTVTLPRERPNKTFTFIASHSMKQSDALESYKTALNELSNDVMVKSHKQGWKDLWEEGRIDIEGNQELSTDVIAATYNILCSLPTRDDPVTPFYGLGPGGLSRGGLLVTDKPGGPRNDYAGHVFWDMDTWIMPPIMMFHPNMARRMIGSRTRVIHQVKENARMDGFKGVKFPWEQGIEVTPKWAGNMSLYQIHITADVAYSLRQYVYAVDDVTILTDGKGFELALDIARFWQSRVTNTDEHTVEILGVMGPDEYHPNINNSVYTNYNAKLSLLLPQYLCEKYHLEVNDTLREEMKHFADTANKMLILYDKTLNFHPQYENFNINASVKIKQSDVILLGYPLMMNMSRDTRRNDLELYEKVTNPQGPDTGTWSMHTVGWLELGDEIRAQENFKMMFRNINEPFKVFSEKPVTKTAYGGCVNFITGAGGLLQSVMFGYGGLRLNPDRMDFNPYLLPNSSSWTMVGVHYKRVTFDIRVTADNLTITVTRKPIDSHVTITTSGQQRYKELLVNITQTFNRAFSSIRVHEGDPTERYSTPSSSVATSPTLKTTTSKAAALKITDYMFRLNAVIILLQKL